MTIFSVILLAASHLDIVAARLTNASGGEVGLQNDLLYTIRMVEKDLLDAGEVVIEDQSGLPAAIQFLAKEINPSTIAVGANERIDAHYEIDVTPTESVGMPEEGRLCDGPTICFRRELRRVNTLNESFTVISTEELITSGIILQLKRDQNNNYLSVVSMIAGTPIVTIHLAGRTVLPDQTMQISNLGVSQSVFLRTAAVTVPPIIVQGGP